MCLIDAVERTRCNQGPSAWCKLGTISFLIHLWVGTEELTLILPLLRQLLCKSWLSWFLYQEVLFWDNPSPFESQHNGMLEQCFAVNSLHWLAVLCRQNGLLATGEGRLESPGMMFSCNLFSSAHTVFSHTDTPIFWFSISPLLASSQECISDPSAWFQTKIEILYHITCRYIHNLIQISFVSFRWNSFAGCHASILFRFGCVVLFTFNVAPIISRWISPESIS